MWGKAKKRAKGHFWGVSPSGLYFKSLCGLLEKKIEVCDEFKEPVCSTCFKVRAKSQETGKFQKFKRYIIQLNPVCVKVDPGGQWIFDPDFEVGE